MHSPPILTSITFFLLLLTTAHSTDPLNYNCSTTGTPFSPYDSFHSSLFSLFSHLYTHAPPSGYALSASSPAYAMAYCRGDSSPDDCRSCINEATVKLPTLCLNNKTAIIWYDGCVLKYSDNKFFGKLDLSNKFALVNVNTLTTSKKFVDLTSSFLGNISNSAAVSSRKYYAKEIKVFEFLTLYGYAQCSGDVEVEECRRCLGVAEKRVAGCCGGRQGARFVSGSCTIRYEIYPIVRSQKSS